MAPKSCKMKIHFWNHFLPIRRRPIRDDRGTLSPRNPPLFSFQHNATSTPLRCASRHPPPCPVGTSGVFIEPLGWFCGPGPGSGSGTGFLSLKGSQGVALNPCRVTFFHVFFESFSNPLKSTFGAHLVLNWCQNYPQKWACLGARRHQKNDLA